MSDEYELPADAPAWMVNIAGMANMFREETSVIKALREEGRLSIAGLVSSAASNVWNVKVDESITDSVDDNGIMVYPALDLALANTPAGSFVKVHLKSDIKVPDFDLRGRIAEILKDPLFGSARPVMQCEVVDLVSLNRVKGMYCGTMVLKGVAVKTGRKVVAGGFHHSGFIRPYMVGTNVSLFDCGIELQEGDFFNSYVASVSSLSFHTYGAGVDITFDPAVSESERGWLINANGAPILKGLTNFTTPNNVDIRTLITGVAIDSYGSPKTALTNMHENWG